MIQNPFSEFSAGVQVLIGIVSLVTVSLFGIFVAILSRIISKSLKKVFGHKN